MLLDRTVADHDIMDVLGYRVHLAGHELPPLSVDLTSGLLGYLHVEHHPWVLPFQLLEQGAGRQMIRQFLCSLGPRKLPRLWRPNLGIDPQPSPILVVVPHEFHEMFEVWFVPPAAHKALFLAAGYHRRC